jgi:hypothetical protein
MAKFVLGQILSLSLYFIMPLVYRTTIKKMFCRFFPATTSLMLLNFHHSKILDTCPTYTVLSLVLILDKLFTS